MSDWVLTLGVGLLVSGLVLGYFMLPKQIPVSDGMTAVGSVLKGVLVIAGLIGRLFLVHGLVSPGFLDADLDRCAEAYGDSYLPEYVDDSVYCVDNVTGDSVYLRGQ